MIIVRLVLAESCTCTYYKRLAQKNSCYNKDRLKKKKHSWSKKKITNFSTA